MAKHPHKLMLHQKKTWKCMLPGCRSFWHVGLQYALLSQMAICWECGEEFMIDDVALRDEQPICSMCRGRKSGYDVDAMGDFIEAQLELSKQGVKSVKDLDPQKRRLIEAVKGIKFNTLEQKDEIEVIEPDEEHAPDCDVYTTGECTCK